MSPIVLAAWSLLMVGLGASGLYLTAHGRNLWIRRRYLLELRRTLRAMGREVPPPTLAELLDEHDPDAATAREVSRPANMRARDVVIRGKIDEFSRISDGIGAGVVLPHPPGWGALTPDQATERFADARKETP